MAMSKYRAVPVVVGGIRFASKAEARRYGELWLLEKAGEITQLELQPKYALMSAGERIAWYVADFRYVQNGALVVEDVKGVKTPVYKLKKKLAETQYGIEIKEVTYR